ncbi:putative nucleotidyltransferase, ribonuclease H [Tanacetum coccineum]
MSPREHEELRRQVEELVSKGHIHESMSPCVVPALLTPKKDGSWCMCVDSQAINKITMRYRFPIPCLDDLLDQISGATIFRKLDLKSGYYQIRLRPGDEWKTTFKTRKGLYEWLVMPFSLSNAPSTFMRVMNQLLRPFMRKFVVVYFDDILIYSASFSEHVTHVRRVLTLLRKDSFYAATKKCVFMTPKVLFLGRFISNFSSIMALLMDCMKGKSFVWTKEAESAFQVVKEKLTTTPILVLPDFSKVFKLHTDALKVAIGGVLSQGGRPVAYFSKKLTEPKSRYTTYDLEFYVVVQAHGRWLAFLEKFTFVVKHKTGVSNRVADALSRRSNLLVSMQVDVPGLDVIREQLTLDPYFSNVLQGVQSGQKPDYNIHDGFVFIGNQLCIPNTSLRLKIIKELHDEGHVGRDRTLQLVQASYFWPTMRKEVDHYVKRCRICHVSKGTATNAGLYMPLPVPVQPYQHGFCVGVTSYSKGCLVGDHVKAWDQKLCQAKVAHNHDVNRSTGFSPFQVVYSAQPRGPLDLMSLPVSGSVPKKVQDFVEGLREVHKVVCDKLVRANSKYKQDADQKRRQLSAKKIGPLEIVEKINSNAYRLKLPSHIRCSGVFNVKHLLPYHGDSSAGDLVVNSRANFVYPGGNDAGPNNPFQAHDQPFRSLERGERHGQHPDFNIHDGFLFKGNQLCIPDTSLRLKIIKELHGEGHVGRDRTLKLVQASYFWPTMRKEVDRYVKRCRICQVSKGTATNAGLYMPLPVPLQPWVDISMDFVLGLPRTQSVMNSIFVVVDVFSKNGSLYSMQEDDRCSYCGPTFPLDVLWKMVNTQLNFSSAYHPQTDGQTEVVNRSRNLLRFWWGDPLIAWDHKSSQLSLLLIMLSIEARFSPTSGGFFVEGLHEVHKAVGITLVRANSNYKQRLVALSRDSTDDGSCEELEYPFFEGDGSSSNEWRDYGMASNDYEGPPVFDDDQYEEESMPLYDTDIEDVIDEEEGFIGKGTFGGEEDNIEDVVVVANDLCSSMIQTTVSVDFSKIVYSNPNELIWLQKDDQASKSSHYKERTFDARDTNLDATSRRDE